MSIAAIDIKTHFQKVFNTTSTPIITRSPGRINIIGEHTDYNDGFVLPAAIDKHAYIAIHPRSGSLFSLYANEFKAAFEGDLNTIQKSDCHWANYILGVMDQLQKAGHTLGGFDMYIDGDIPIGAGLSSSAALECATLFAFNEAFSLGLTREAMAYMAQKAEHEFAGVKCGIMDMFASLYGKEGHVFQLDCRSLTHTYLPLNLHGYKLVLFNTNVKHQLASSEYNTRRKQCEQGVAWVKDFVPEVVKLRDVTVDMLDSYVLPKDEVVYQRCKYIVEENMRLQGAAADLINGDIAALGAKMFQTHIGLSQGFEVSCKELDILVDCVKAEEAVIGARMMGGGFGGCTINLIKEDTMDRIIESVKIKYEKQTELPLTYYIVAIGTGTELISE
jgi:galactokinase